ncbi:hypothetical protein B0H67DRAFT_603657 [Lasiosphaeris hirsuta]|uniref:FAD-binding FR-type domain-containing protein n=1 Tax=Lasiosphaeris hirsuta TaxID=260670 RepID=A0AA39ZVW6_9PEZI|nr:hypothetical protein B0H67DRAFT_603657 [Lasiosphaeris hirsuta]
MLFLESLVRLPRYLPGFMKRHKNPNSLLNHFPPRVFLHKLATLPSPIPFLIRHTIPSLPRCLVFTGLSILWGWNRIRYSTDYQLYGWLTIANDGLALLLPFRTNLFSIIARIPAPTLLMYHRWAGVAAVTHASLHFGLTAQQYIRTRQLDTVLQNTRIRIGIMAWAALALMLLTSLRIVRRRAFELFYYLHFAFLIFIGGALYHATYGFEFLLPGLILWALDRVARWYLWYFRNITVTEVTHYHSGNVTKIKFEGAGTTAAGQTWVQIPSAPGGNGGVLAVRGLGAMGSGCGGGGGDHGKMRVRLDGPYGVEPLPWAKFPVVVLIAGRIGITPAMSIASHLVKQGATGGGLAGGEKHIHLLWCVSDVSHACWFQEELKALMALCLPTVSLDISIHVTGGASASSEVRMAREEVGLGGAMCDGLPGEVHRGKPDLGFWFQRLKGLRLGVDVAVNLCGLRSLVDDARRAAADVSAKTGLFNVQEEVFEFRGTT